MTIQTKLAAVLTVRSFSYVARRLAKSSAALTPSAQYERILAEAEKHRGALRLARRDAFEMAEQGLRRQTLTRAEFDRLRETTAQTIARAEQSIARIAAQYAPHKLAA